MLLKFLEKADNVKLLNKCLHGLERECLRINKQAQLSDQDHPEKLGSKLTHPYITADFCESQLELVTPPETKISKAIEFLSDLHCFINKNNQSECLWPFSTPCELPEDKNKIKIADFGSSHEGQKRTMYRVGLSDRYGRAMQTVSGTHYNVSFSLEFWEKWHKASGSKKDLQTFIDDSYFHIARNFLRYAWINTYLFGATPAIDKSYLPKKQRPLEKLDESSYFLPKGTSIRMSNLGYYSKVQAQLQVSYKNLKEYLSDLNYAITTPEPSYRKYKGLNQNILQIENEHYSRIRVKRVPEGDKSVLESLKEKGVQYLELRTLDLNPFEPIGINSDQIHFLHLLVIYCLAAPSPAIDEKEAKEIRETQNQVALYGRDETLKIKQKCKKKLFTEHAHKLLKELEPFAQLVHKKQVLEKQIAKIDNQDLLPSTQVLKELESKSFADYGFELAKKYHHMFCSGEANKERHQMLHRLAVSSLQEQHNLELRDSAYISGYEDLEISTQMLIKEALKRKVEVEVLDRYDNFIRLRRGRRTKFVKQATQTNVDSQVSYFMMENKTVSKIVLNEAGVAVAGGKTFYEIDKALDYAANLNFEGSVIIKPTHTNYGKGITVVEDSSDKSQMRAALKTAFSFGQAVLIEEYIQAKEYRFLVIGGKCRAVLHREPANVLGDGVNTIKHLVEAKNADPAHFKFFKGYEITLGQTEKEFLAQSGLDFESVPKLNEKIYLRSNSNVSTGGDAHDLTFEMDESYKKVAQAAAKAAKAEICGVDMMIKDITQPAVFKAQNRFFKWIKSLFTRKKAQVTEVKPEFDFQTKKNYAVIEINFNPNLQIHGYPVSGQTINVAGYVLDLLGFK